MSRTLITGGTGFIGSALVKRLIARGDELVIFDNDFRGSKQRLEDYSKKIKLVNGDVRKPNEVLKAVKGCDSIFHLAFVNGTRFFYEKPDLVLDVGIKGAISTLEAAIKSKVKTYVLASSSEVYQEPTHVPTKENERAIIPDVLNARYSYAGGKLISELLAINYLRKTNIRTLIFRPHNVFGPDMGFEHVIPEIMKKLYMATDGWSKKTCNITIQGDGNDTRSFCYVEDAIDQIVEIFNNGQKDNIYHVGMDAERSINDLIKDLGVILGVIINIVPGEKPIGGTSRRRPDIGKVKSLGYNHEDHYKDGLIKTVNWYKDYFTNSKSSKFL